MIRLFPYRHTSIDLEVMLVQSPDDVTIPAIGLAIGAMNPAFLTY
jgi:hypothetical protein